MLLNVDNRRYFRELVRVACLCYAVPMVRGSPNPRHLGLATRLKRVRKQTELTRMALAQLAGGGETVSLDLETGRRIPTVGTVARIAAALGVDAGWLAFAIGEQATSSAKQTTDGMGERLASLRTERGLTKAALARMVNLSPSAYAKIENGGQTGIDTLEKLADALGVSPAWLAFSTAPREVPRRRRARSPGLSAARA